VNTEPKRSEIWDALAIAGVSLLLLSQCLRAPFINYDDNAHINIIPEIFGKAPLWKVFVPREGAYIPLTWFSYRIDYLLFHEGLGIESWAPGVRLMNWLYHALASLALWRVLRLIGVERLPALFIGLIFAIHPTCCESVCWVSERKNILAATFGFAALLAYIRFDARIFRLPLVVALYATALFCKPSALGLLPIFALIDLFGGSAGLRGTGPLRALPNRTWLDTIERMVPLLLVSVFSFHMNVSGEAGSLLEPPGGSIFTALLTDLEVFVRYLKMLLLPTDLSAAYYVEPIVSLSDPRVAGFGCVLVALIALTVWLAASRRRAIFGWLWFFAAIGPVANLVPNSYPMADRYVYLSMPGFFLALCEGLSGLLIRMKSVSPLFVRSAAGAFVVFLSLLSIQRSAVFVDSIDLFRDAATKQPLAAFAHYGLSSSYTAKWQDLKDKPDANPEDVKKFKLSAIEQRAIFLECPDAYRQAYFPHFALEAGEAALEAGDFRAAERYLNLCAYPLRGARSTTAFRSAALRELALLRMKQGAREDEAYTFANQSVQIAPIEFRDLSLLVRAGVALALARTPGASARAAELQAQAREDLTSIPEKSEAYPRAQEMIRRNFKD
jgi:hypothetical protein